MVQEKGLTNKIKKIILVKHTSKMLKIISGKYNLKKHIYAPKDYFEKNFHFTGISVTSRAYLVW